MNGGSVTRRAGPAKRVCFSPLLTIFGCIFIVLNQWFICEHRGQLDQLRIDASTGMQEDAKFFYFYRTLGLFPLTLPEDLSTRELSSNAANELLASRGSSLMTEFELTVRYGDHGKVWLYFPWSWWTGTAQPLLWPFHAFLFAAALCLIFLSFASIGRPTIGVILAIFCGSNPFQLTQVFLNENIFSWPITTALLALAAAIPFITAEKKSLRSVVAFAIISGVALGTVRQIRSEPTAIIISLVFVFLFLSQERWVKRIFATAIFLISFLGSVSLWSHYWNIKSSEAEAVAAALNGNVYNGPKINTHNVFHPLWCGLGDFDKKYGHVWYDGAAVIAATPLLREKYGLSLPDLEWGKYFYEQWYDARKQYQVSPMLLPHYPEAIRDILLREVSSDPVWYLRVLLQRFNFILTNTTPLTARIGRWQIQFPWNGWAALLSIFPLLYWRRWFEIKLICFLIPTSLTALLIYSGKGTQQYFIGHIAVAAVLLSLSFEFLFQRLRLDIFRDR